MESNNSQPSSNESPTEPQQSVNENIQSTNSHKFFNKKIIITVVIIAIVVLVTIFFIARRNTTEKQAQSETKIEMIDPATLTDIDKREINQAVAEGHLNYLAEQKDNRGVYLDYAGNAFCEEGSSCQSISSNRAFLPAIWARYQYYLLTEDATQLQILKDDIKQAQTAILDGYDEDGAKNVIQNNFFNCYFMKSMIEDEKEVLTIWEKNTLKRFCVESNYEWLDQEEITSIGDENPDRQAIIIPTESVSKSTLIDEINNKIKTINNNDIASYDLEQDYVYQNFSTEVKSFLIPEQLQSADRFFRGFTKNYYYFAFDQLARYQIEPNDDNNYLALVLINDFLSIYLYSQQQTEPIFYVNVDNCFLVPLITKAQEILPEGKDLLTPTVNIPEPNFDINTALNDDENSQPTLACWLILFDNNNLNETRVSQFQEAVFNYFGNESFSNNIVKSSLLTGLLSQSLRN
ncbi:MAG: hypothetical protein Q4G02_01370 [bacterium]|nr:hypothetical protein [bacterium]